VSGYRPSLVPPYPLPIHTVGSISTYGVYREGYRRGDGGITEAWIVTLGWRTRMSALRTAAFNRTRLTAHLDMPDGFETLRALCLNQKPVS
jgi:hypothetical protein